MTDELESLPADGTHPPRTLAEFRALPDEGRRAAAWRMSRSQRDELLGRSDVGLDERSFL